jgi:nucleoside transporter
MTFIIFIRLCAIVFLHYFVWGTWYVTMVTYLTQSLGFSGEQVGFAYGTVAIGAMVSPFFIGIVADRVFAAERILAILHVIGAGLLYLVSTCQEFGAFYIVLIAYTISYMAGHSLINAMTLYHCKNPTREYPLIMLMGSVGWIVAGNAVSWLKLENSPNMFRLAAGAALAAGIYSLTLPFTPPSGKSALSPRIILGLDALRMLRDRSFATFMICSFLICIPLSFYFGWMNLFMHELQIPNAAAKMTIGQMSDVVFLLLLPLLSWRLGVKGILLLGLGAWAVRFSLFAWFDQDRAALWMLFVGIGVHGMCYDFIFVMGRMYVDQHATTDIRAAAQGLHAWVTLGMGMFVGTSLSGIVGQHYAFADSGGNLMHHWQSIWIVPAFLSAALFVAFAACFKAKSAT